MRGTMTKRTSIPRREVANFNVPPHPARPSERLSIVGKEKNQTTYDKRRMGDLFDFTCNEEFDSNEATSQSATDSSLTLRSDESLSTISRYPCSETRNLNCWSEPDANDFKVRGEDYLSKKKKTAKVPSSSFLFPARGADLFLSEEWGPENIGRHPGILGGELRKKPTFLVNFRFPWGVLVLYFDIPERYLPFLRERYAGGKKPTSSIESFPPHDRAVCRFLLGDDSFKNGKLKLIPVVVDGPWIVTCMVTGKPCIIGNKLPVKYVYGAADNAKGLCDYLEADLDIGSSSKTAKKIVSVCRRYMSSLVVDIGFVIEGESDDELPERMLGSVRIHHIDPLKSSTLRWS